MSLKLKFQLSFIIRYSSISTGLKIKIENLNPFVIYFRKARSLEIAPKLRVRVSIRECLVPF